MNEERLRYLSGGENNLPHPCNIDITTFNEGLTVQVTCSRDIVEARQKGRIMAQEMGGSSTAATLIATIISELARNIILYAGHGEIDIRKVENGRRSGVRIIASDEGPGIANIPRAMMNGYSTSGGLGLGLPGVRQIADSFRITSTPGAGVAVEVAMWLGNK